MWVPAKVTGRELVGIFCAKSGETSPTRIARALGYSVRHVRRLLAGELLELQYVPGWVPIPSAILCRTDLTLPGKVLAGSSQRYGTGATARIRLGWDRQRARRARRALDRSAFNTSPQSPAAKRSFRTPPRGHFEPPSLEHPSTLACTSTIPSDARAKPAANGWEAALKPEARVDLVGGPHAPSLLRVFTQLGFFDRSEASRADFARRMAASSWTVERVLGLAQLLIDAPASLGRVRSRTGTLRVWLERGTAPKAAALPVGKALARSLRAFDQAKERDAAERATAARSLEQVAGALSSATMKIADVLEVLATMKLSATEHRSAAIFVADAGGRNPLAALATWATRGNKRDLFVAALPPDLRATVLRALMPVP